MICNKPTFRFPTWMQTFTWIAEFTLMSIVASVCGSAMSAGVTHPLARVVVNYLPGALTCANMLMLEGLYMFCFAQQISAHKTAKSVMTWENFVFVARGQAILFAWVVFGTLVLDVFDETKFYRVGITPPTWQTFAEAILKDTFCFRVLHTMAHAGSFRGSLYQHHKLHHEEKKDLTGLGCFRMTWLDALVEQHGGIVLFVLAAYATKVITGALLFRVTPYVLLTSEKGNIAAHSCNPYSLVALSFTSYFFVVNVHHNLHHVLSSEYMAVFPYHHILFWRRQKEIDRYNEVMGTKFEFMRLGF